MISKVSLLFSIFFILAAVFSGIYLAKVKDAGKKKWKLLFYLIVTGILIGLTGILGFFEFVKLPVWIFIIALVWLLIIGILHAWLFEKIIPLENKKLGKILFTLALCFFGYGLVILSYKLYFHTSFPRFYLLPAFLFIAPTFVLIAFDYFIKIPMKIYKVWDFPTPGTLPDPNDSEMADPIIINFEICKQIKESRTVFKAKAPKAMDLGRLFYFFIIDYNSRHSNNPILINDSNNKLFKWSFFITPNIISGKKHLDPELSISENKLKENGSIICERIII